MHSNVKNAVLQTEIKNASAHLSNVSWAVGYADGSRSICQIIMDFCKSGQDMESIQDFCKRTLDADRDATIQTYVNLRENAVEREKMERIWAEVKNFGNSKQS